MLGENRTTGLSHPVAEENEFEPGIPAGLIPCHLVPANGVEWCYQIRYRSVWADLKYSTIPNDSIQNLQNQKPFWSYPMFCGECGTDNPDTNQFCKNCGTSLRKTQPSAAPAPATPAPVAISPPTASINVTAETAVKKPGLGTQIGKRKFSIFSILCAAASFFIYPYILGILAILFAGIALFKKDYLGILGIIIAATSLGLDWFYLDIFPPPPIV
jgi:hypothetical protein